MGYPVGKILSSYSRPRPPSGNLPSLHLLVEANKISGAVEGEMW